MSQLPLHACSVSSFVSFSQLLQVVAHGAKTEKILLLSPVVMTGAGEGYSGAQPPDRVSVLSLQPVQSHRAPHFQRAWARIHALLFLP